MKRSYSNYTVIMIALAAAFLMTVNGLLGFVLTEQSKAAMKALIHSRMLDISNTAADMLDGDKLKNLKAEDKGTPPYQHVHDTLNYFRENINLSFIYCVQAAGEKEFVFSVDPDPDDPGEFGSPVVYTDALYKASKGTPAVDDEPYSDAWGRFYSAYSPVFDSNGRVAGIVAVDFSAKWYDEQIAIQEKTIIICMLVSLLIYVILVVAVTRRLRRRVHDVTHELRSALEAADAANKAKTLFLSHMSHEIRTPMNAIIGLNSLALTNPNLPDSTKAQLEKIGASAKHLLSIINDILDVSRIESGKATLKNAEFSLSVMLDQVNSIVGSQCAYKGIKYVCHVPDGQWDVYIGDDMKLRQILINILGNAVKFTPKDGTVELRVEPTARFHHKSTLRFTIRDTGAGISKDFLPKIFNAFTQEKTSVENRYGSTGLGMAITKGLVDLMNGEISVESEKGVGTTFMVTVTLTEADENAEIRNTTKTETEMVSVPEEAAAAELSGRRILLAEDMPVNAEIVKEVLKMKGIETEHAENGSIAAEMFKSNPEGYYDAILMDMRMPVMDGLESTRQIRSASHPDAKSIPIIALTANAFEEDVQRSMQTGINAHLSKPINPEDIFTTLAELITKRESLKTNAFESSKP